MNDYQILFRTSISLLIKKNPAWRGVCDIGFEDFLTKFVFGKRNN
jgi:hypothetical protein